MHNKISHSIKCYSVADRHGFGKSVHHAQHDAQPTGNSENEKEEIVLFKEARFLLVVVFVDRPKKTMHNVLMCEPRHEFHEKECSDDDPEPAPNAHNIKFSAAKKSN